MDAAKGAGGCERPDRWSDLADRSGPRAGAYRGRPLLQRRDPDRPGDRQRGLPDGPLHEVIIVDDGSTDALRAAIAAYGTRVRAHHGPNRGAQMARNVGL